ncbi:DUF3307 domain-containing protein [Haloimpatiens sp. FM7330]|uniref:DUF3307 domain-containing protein n=1 Tax=Haloimpatiens sp. FM7330 TaxID=3298610 RepID=UPI003639DFF6
MHIRIVLLFIIVHLLCDFVFQGKSILYMRFKTEKTVLHKVLKDSLIGNLLHSLIHFIGMIIVLIIYIILDKSIAFTHYLKISLFIFLIHFVIDEAKSLSIYFKPSFNNNIHVFIIDQILHIITIILLSFDFNTKMISMKLTSIFNNYPNNITLLDRWLILIIIFLWCTFGIGIFIRKFINYINLKEYSKIIDRGIIIKKAKDESLGAKNGGFLIGIIERIFILLVMTMGQPVMIGFVLTGKSIARFKKLDDSSFAEYFLIGTFTSFIAAIIGGIIIKTLNIVPVIK